MANLNLKDGKQNTYPQIRQSDLKDPTLFALNTSLTFLYSQIDKLQNLPTGTTAAAAANSITGGVAGQVLTSNGAGPATFQNFLTSNPHLAASGALNPLTNAYQDITGATITLNLDGDWLLLITFDLHATVNAGGAFGICEYDGGFTQTPEVAVAQLTTATASDSIEQSIPMVCLITGNVGSKIAKLQAKKSAGAGTAFANTSQIKAIFLGNP